MRKPWHCSLRKKLSRLRTKLAREPHIAIVGVGQMLRGDDGAGVAVVRTLQPLVATHARVLVLDAGAAPENQLGPLRRFVPDLVLFVDAAQMGEPPGTVCLLSPEETTGLSASTHTLPVGVIAHYLRAELGCEVAVIGIQPARDAFGAELSEAVQEAVDAVVQELGVVLSRGAVRRTIQWSG